MKTTMLKMGNAALRAYVEALEEETKKLRLEGNLPMARLVDEVLAQAGAEVVRRIVRGEMSLLR